MKIFGFIWSLFSLPFAVIGLVLFFFEVEFAISAVPATAQITFISDDDEICSTVSYQPAKGPVVKTKLGYCSNLGSPKVGQLIQIKYLPDNPKNARVAQTGPEMLIFSLIFSAMGTIFVLIGIAMINGAMKDEKRKKWLRLHGQPIIAELSEIGEETEYSTWYRPFFKWTNPQDAQIYTFGGKQYATREKIPPGNRVKVLIDPANPGNYLVDMATIYFGYADAPSPPYTDAPAAQGWPSA